MNRIISKADASLLVTATGGTDYVQISNPEYIFAPYDIIPLADKVTPPVDEITAVVMDMDGTTTSTEHLCIHSLEFMVRMMNGKFSEKEWEGLGAEDHPFIIGNSTTKHVEYLIGKFHKTFQNSFIIKHFLKAAFWTILLGKDRQRKEEALNALSYFNIHPEKTQYESETYEENIQALVSKFLGTLDPEELKFSNSDLVKIGIEIYYQRYHELLTKIDGGLSEEVSIDIFGDGNKALIEPMPGIPLMLPLLKGMLTVEDFITISEALNVKSDSILPRNDIEQIIRYFATQPQKTAVVTSSIRYEAEIVMTEVFRVLNNFYKSLELSDSFQKAIGVTFHDFSCFYDAVITASDSSEIRLKPHRDLYSLALHRLNISKDEFGKVLGLEDSESGTIAIRAAGIGLCVAVPFAETSGHNLEAASVTCGEGILDVIFKHKLFLQLK